MISSDSFPQALPENVVSDLAALAKTPVESRKRFGELLAQAVEEAGFSDFIERKKLPLVTFADVKPFLREALKAAEQAEQAFARLQGEGVNSDNLGAAGLA